MGGARLVGMPSGGGRASSSEGGPPGHLGGDLLHRVALALNSTLELDEVLRLLGDMAREAVAADRCSLFLLEGHLLRPAVSIATASDGDLWAAFRGMGSIRVPPRSPVWELLTSENSVAVEDPAASELIPRSWVERFDVRSAVLVPLRAAGTPCGLMAVDYAQARSFGVHELVTLDAIGAYAGVAVRNARLYESTKQRARAQEALARGGAALVSTLEPEQAAGALVDAYLDLTGAESCAIALFDLEHTQITTLATRGVGEEVAPVPFELVPDHIRERVTEAWTERPDPVEFGPDQWLRGIVGSAEDVSHVVLPLPSGAGHARGAVLLGLREGQRLRGEERRAALTLAAIAAAALERASLLTRLRRQLLSLEVLYALSTAITERADAPRLVTKLNELLAQHGIEVDSIALRKRPLRDRLNAATATATERDAWRRELGCVAIDDGLLAVPMRVGARTIGALRVRPQSLPAEERSFLEIVGRGVAEVATRRALRTAVEESARDQAVTGERERIGADLHDTVGQLFVAMGLLSRQAAGELPSDSHWSSRFVRLGSLADRGKWEIDQAVRALSFLPASRRGLPVALRSLATSFSSDSGIQVLVDVPSEQQRLPSDIERALYRVAHEALINAWRHARCALIRIHLEEEQGEVVLRIRDDGLGLGPRTESSSEGIGLRNLRRAMDDVGGTVRVQNSHPRGVVVEARVGVEPR